MKKQPEITEATRRDFINAFCDFYQDRPIEKITVKEISEKAGYSRVTFYNYFNDPYDLLSQVEEEFVSSFMRTVSENIEQNKLFDNFLNSFNQLLSENEVYSRILLNPSYTMQFTKRLQQRVIPMALETFRISADNKKAMYAFEFYIPGIISMITSWIRNQRDLPIDELGNIIKGIIKDGLLSQFAQMK